MTTAQHTLHDEPPERALLHRPRVMLTVEEAADALSIGRTRVFQLIRDGQLGSVKIGHSRRIPLQDLQAFVDGLVAGRDVA